MTIEDAIKQASDEILGNPIANLFRATKLLTVGMTKAQIEANWETISSNAATICMVNCAATMTKEEALAHGIEWSVMTTYGKKQREDLEARVLELLG